MTAPRITTDSYKIRSCHRIQSNAPKWADMGSNTFVYNLEEFIYFCSKYLYLTYRNKKYLYLKTFLQYLTFSFTFKYFLKHIVSINISVSRSHVMPAKLITFTATSPNSANY